MEEDIRGISGDGKKNTIKKETIRKKETREYMLCDSVSVKFKDSRRLYHYRNQNIGVLVTEKCWGASRGCWTCSPP